MHCGWKWKSVALALKPLSYWLELLSEVLRSASASANIR
jgi:hypothetical protein